jgi:uncharacterized membrane protein
MNTAVGTVTTEIPGEIRSGGGVGGIVGGVVGVGVAIFILLVVITVVVLVLKKHKSQKMDGNASSRGNYFPNAVYGAGLLASPLRLKGCM